jgi:tellurite resistance protein TerC
MFIGTKMLLHTFFHIEIPTMTSLLVIVGIIVLSIIASILFPIKEEEKA